jgi:hypothetical protein
MLAQGKLFLVVADGEDGPELVPANFRGSGDEVALKLAALPPSAANPSTPTARRGAAMRWARGDPG